MTPTRLKRKMPLRRRVPIRPISARRLREIAAYPDKLRRFLLDHPYCQVWLQEHGIDEADCVSAGGRVRLSDKTVVTAPIATEVHHRDKRRGRRLLRTSHWLAVSRAAHARIEAHKAWARMRGYLADF